MFPAVPPSPICSVAPGDSIPDRRRGVSVGTALAERAAADHRQLLRCAADVAGYGQRGTGAIVASRSFDSASVRGHRSFPLITSSPAGIAVPVFSVITSPAPPLIVYPPELSNDQRTDRLGPIDLHRAAARELADYALALTVFGIPAVQFPLVVHRPVPALLFHSDARSTTVSVIAVFAASFCSV